MAKKKQDVDQREELIASITETLNKESSDGTIAFLEDNPADLTDFISTGNSILDLAISNRPNGGIACGRITELNGLEGSGKSVIGAHLIANVQKEGGVGVLLDTEFAMNEEFFKAIGIDRNKMVYAQPICLENVFESIETIIRKVRESENNKKKIVIVVDSIAGVPTKQELEADYDKDGYATTKAIIMGKAMRKITQLIAKEKIALVFTNQLRQKMNAMPFGDQWTTSGGKALAFHASTRVRLNLTGKIANKDKKVIGVTVEAKVIKNRLGPPHRTASFNIYFDRGIDDVDSWFQFCKNNGIISGAAHLSYTSDSGEEFKFTSREWNEFLNNNSTIKDEIYNKMCKVMISSYSSTGLTSDDIDVVESGEE